MVAYYAAAFKTGSYPSITQDQVWLISRSHPVGVDVADPLGKPTGWDWVRTSPTCNATYWPGCNLQESDNLQAVVFATAPAMLNLASGANAHTVTVNAGINKVTIPNAPGTISGTLVRGGQTIIDVTPTASQFTFVQTPKSYNYNAFVAHGSA
jgi:glucan endo-1,3-alpha-glucosidase